DERPHHPFVHPSVKVEPDIQAVAELFTQQAHDLHHISDIFPGSYPFHGARGVHLYRTVSRVYAIPRLLDDHRWVIAANPAIHLHLRAHRTAKQLVYWQTDSFTLDIPQRLVYPRNGAHQHRPAPVEAAAV